MLVMYIDIIYQFSYFYFWVRREECPHGTMLIISTFIISKKREKNFINFFQRPKKLIMLFLFIWFSSFSLFTDSSFYSSAIKISPTSEISHQGQGEMCPCVQTIQRHSIDVIMGGILVKDDIILLLQVVYKLELE